MELVDLLTVNSYKSEVPLHFTLLLNLGFFFSIPIPTKHASLFLPFTPPHLIFSFSLSLLFYLSPNPNIHNKRGGTINGGVQSRRRLRLLVQGGPHR